MKILFIGESWLGSCARAMREGFRAALASEGGELDEVSEDLFAPKARAKWLRAVNRILAPAYRSELANAVLSKCRGDRPDAVVVYKGSWIAPEVVRRIKAAGILTVNVFPDYSPHAYGARLREAIGEYDLVASTKPFHPGRWRDTYGYDNKCIFVPHGYDPAVHLRDSPPSEFRYDVGMVATWRMEYHDMMERLAARLSTGISVAIAGGGWPERSAGFPRNWIFPGEVSGAAYPNWARQCRIVLAPVHRTVVIDGRRQPGDEDTSRTYELAAANCFFIHRRTDYVRQVYSEDREVPLFDTPEELADVVELFLKDEARRRAMASAAHRRAVPAYSVESRARDVLTVIRGEMEARARHAVRPA